MIGLEGVFASYDHHVVLRDVTFRVEPDSFTGVVGPSGSGKTTLLRLLLGTMKPQSGSIRREGRLKVAYVPQLETVDWNFPVTVEECVLMSRPQGRLLPRATATERRDVEEMLERLGIGGVGQRHIRDLSGGQQQRMFIARALLRRPELLLLDEPTSGVDVSTRHDMLHLLADLHESGLAIVLTTHDLNGMAAHLPHLVCLNHRIVSEGSPAEVLTPDTLEQTFGARMEVLEHLGMRIVVDEAPSLRPASGA
ncbi:MAG TPA: metal ABC transporter ATP-binding protein [Actinobacteria bacterium]|nr:metal ABC transporter ATP-binding protein [Actinomycetota bacterium]